MVAGWISRLVEISTHLDKHLALVVAQYGFWAYPIIFAVLALETGDLISAFLPSDSLVFTAGALAGLGILNIWLLFVVCAAAVFVGDTVNYWIGRLAGYIVLQKNFKWFNQKHIDKTKGFFNRYGSFTLIIGRYIPFVRTLTPFFAGIGRMPYWKFSMLEAIGATTWVAVFLFLGYFFGGLPFVQDNFLWIIITLTIVTCIPIIIAFMRYFYNKRKQRIVQKNLQKQIDSRR